MKKLYIAISIVLFSVVIALGFSFSNVFTYQPKTEPDTEPIPELEPEQEPEQQPQPEPRPTKYLMTVTAVSIETSAYRALEYVGKTESGETVWRAVGSTSFTSDSATTQWEYPINETLNYSVEAKYVWGGELDGIYENGSAYNDLYGIVGWYDNETGKVITKVETYNFTNESRLVLTGYGLIVTITLPDRIATFEAKGNQVYGAGCSITIEVSASI